LFANYPGADILILARTDARGTDGLDEAIERCKLFRALGADMTFLEAPLSREEMQVSELPNWLRIRHQEFDVLLSLV
jgi:2-methylisocitrate lyase-like PEP mutase family enzyme